MIRGIIFDCFGVLAHGSLEYLRSLVAAEHLQELNDFSVRSDRGFVSRDDYMKQVGLLLGKTPQEVDNIVRTQHFRSEAMIQWAGTLHGSYRTALLSNIGRSVIEELFTEDELHALFDAAILSSEIGMVKPEPQAFEYAAAQLSLLPKECVMIDDLTSNIEGAKAVGMQGIVFKDIEQCKTELARILESTHA